MKLASHPITTRPSQKADNIKPTMKATKMHLENLEKKNSSERHRKGESKNDVGKANPKKTIYRKK